MLRLQSLSCITDMDKHVLLAHAEMVTLPELLVARPRSNPPTSFLLTCSSRHVQLPDWSGETRDPEWGGPADQWDAGAGETPAAAAAAAGTGGSIWALLRRGGSVGLDFKWNSSGSLFHLIATSDHIGNHHRCHRCNTEVLSAAERNIVLISPISVSNASHCYLWHYKFSNMNYLKVFVWVAQ